MHVYFLTLGEFATDDYSVGENKLQSTMLEIYFLMATFFFVIHLLNMLIAIMSEVFTENNEVKYMQQTKSHLQLVRDNLWMHKQVIPEPEKIKYVVVAFSTLEKDKDEEDYLEVVIDKQNRTEAVNEKQFESLNKAIRNIKTKVEQIAGHMKFWTFRE